MVRLRGTLRTGFWTEGGVRSEADYAALSPIARQKDPGPKPSDFR